MASPGNSPPDHVIISKRDVFGELHSSVKQWTNFFSEQFKKLAFFVKQRKLLITKVVTGKFPTDYVSA
jgi:ribosome biogenesis GTPase A